MTSFIMPWWEREMFPSPIWELEVYSRRTQKRMYSSAHWDFFAQLDMALWFKRNHKNVDVFLTRFPPLPIGG